jgi:predicted methyltransferase
VHAALLGGRDAGVPAVTCSLDLGRSATVVTPAADHWVWHGQRYPYLQACKLRSIYCWDGAGFEAIARYRHSLIKLIPTEWGAPTFEIDGIKMLPTAHVCPYADAQRKVGLIEPGGKRILDTCGGLGYFADCCLRAASRHVQSYEIEADVIWLRSMNPWSPDNRWSKAPAGSLTLINADVSQRIATLPDHSFDAVLHDPPRFGIAGELYSQNFYDQMARVIRRRGRLFHYTGTPNRLTSGRDVPNEVAVRLKRAGFDTQVMGDGILARKKN